MAQQSLVIQVSEEIYARIAKIAEETAKPMEHILADGLTLLFGELPPSEQLTIETLPSLTDEQLWALVYRSFDWADDARLKSLSAKRKQTPLTRDEEQELDTLVAAFDRYVLLRSGALLILKQRGHPVEVRLKDVS